jgi:hypothetical protein
MTNSGPRPFAVAVSIARSTPAPTAGLSPAPAPKEGREVTYRVSGTLNGLGPRRLKGG